MCWRFSAIRRALHGLASVSMMAEWPNGPHIKIFKVPLCSADYSAVHIHITLDSVTVLHEYVLLWTLCYMHMCYLVLCSAHIRVTLDSVTVLHAYMLPWTLCCLHTCYFGLCVACTRVTFCMHTCYLGLCALEPYLKPALVHPVLDGNLYLPFT